MLILFPLFFLLAVTRRTSHKTLQHVFYLAADYPTDGLLKRVAEKIGRGQWRLFAIGTLGISEDIVDQDEPIKKGPNDHVFYEVGKEWRKTYPKNNTTSSLTEAFKQAERENMMDDQTLAALIKELNSEYIIYIYLNQIYIYLFIYRKTSI